MLVSTAYQGPRKEGDVISVPEDFAKRWVKNGIAAYAQEGQETPIDEVLESDDVQGKAHGITEDSAAPEKSTDDNLDYESMSAKELYTLCKDKGIDVEAKKSKEYYIEKLA